MITDLRLQNFRSYSDASFELGEGVNIIVGPNGSGKTNLLEAVLVVASGSSYRASDAELVRFGAPWARLDADQFYAEPVRQAQGKRTVKIQPTDGDRWSKTFEIDEKPLSRLGSASSLPVVLFEPNHLLMFSGSPELRRSFLDDLIEQINPRFGVTRRHYKRVLYQRNALLKKQPRDLREQLFVWNVRLSELGGQIAHERIQLIQDFNKDISGLYAELVSASFPRRRESSKNEPPSAAKSQEDSRINSVLDSRLRGNDVVLEYVSKLPPGGYETALLRKLEDSLELDILRGFTASGPHRDDLGVMLDGHTAATSASRGETRTLVLALKLLELNVVEDTRRAKPLILLDDVFSELDNTRRQALTKKVAGYQTFITTTDADMVLQHFTGSNVIPLSR